MSIVGEGRGFRLLIGLTLLVIGLTIPLWWLEIEAVPPALGRTADGARGPVQVVVRDRAQGDRLVLIVGLARPLAPLAAWSAQVEVIDPITGSEVLAWQDRQLHVDPDHPRRLIIDGPAPTGDLPPNADVRCRLRVGSDPGPGSRLAFRGRYDPDQARLRTISLIETDPSGE